MPEAEANGYSGHGKGGGWRFIGHTTKDQPIAGSATYYCTVGGTESLTTASGQAHCGF